MIAGHASNGFEGCAGKGELGTSSGRMFDVLHPKIDDEHIEEIAHALSQLNRFGGHAKYPYSVAQHSCYCSDVAMAKYPKRPEFGLRMLLHDAAEAYCGDVIRPIKRLPEIYSGYCPLETRIQNAIWKAFFGSNPTNREISYIGSIDASVVMAEAAELMQHSQRWNWGGTVPAEINVVEWSWKKARSSFMERYHSLVERME